VQTHLKKDYSEHLDDPRQWRNNHYPISLQSNENGDVDAVVNDLQVLESSPSTNNEQKKETKILAYI